MSFYSSWTFSDDIALQYALQMDLWKIWTISSTLLAQERKKVSTSLVLINAWSDTFQHFHTCTKALINMVHIYFSPSHKIDGRTDPGRDESAYRDEVLTLSEWCSAATCVWTPQKPKKSSWTSGNTRQIYPPARQRDSRDWWRQHRRSLADPSPA